MSCAVSRSVILLAHWLGIGPETKAGIVRNNTEGAETFLKTAKEVIADLKGRRSPLMWRIQPRHAVVMVSVALPIIFYSTLSLYSTDQTDGNARLSTVVEPPAELGVTETQEKLGVTETQEKLGVTETRSGSWD